MGSVSQGQRGGSRLRRVLSSTLAVLIATTGFVTLGAGTAVASSPASIDSSPAGPLTLSHGAVDATWSITTPDSRSCYLLNGGYGIEQGPVACNSGDVTFSITAAGSYRFQIYDPDSGEVEFSPELDIVTAPDAPTVTSSPTSPYNDPTPSWSFDSAPGAAVTCVLTHRGTTVQTDADCSSPFTADDINGSSTNGDPGNYVFTATQTLGGQTSDPSTDSTYDFETATPDAPDVHADNDGGNGEDPTFTVDGVQGGASLQCWVTPSAGASVGDCGSSSSVDLRGADDDTYTLHVTQTYAGNVSTDGTAAYVLDTTAPGTPHVSAESSFGSDDHPGFDVTGIDTDAHVADCTVDGPSNVSLSSCGASMSLDLSGAKAGIYTVTADAQDKYGNRSSDDHDTYEYLPTAPPAPTVTAQSSNPQDDHPSFSFSDDEVATLTYSCSVSGLPAEDITQCGPTTAILDLSGQSDGSYTVTVTATDLLGQTSDAGTATFTRDVSTPAPVVTLLSPSTSPGSDPSPTFTWADGETLDGPDSFTCVVTAQDGTTVSSGSCAPGDALHLTAGDGTYTVVVKAKDTIGNTASSDPITYTLETGPPTTPTVTIEGASAGKGRTLTFDVSDSSPLSDLTYDCAFGSSSFGQGVSPCGATNTVTIDSTFPDDTYTFYAFATDSLGHRSLAGTATYKLDNKAQAPTVALRATETSPSNNPTPHFVITDNELVGGPDAFTCTWSGPGIVLPVPVSCGSTPSVTAGSDGTYTLSVTATDKFGNSSPTAGTTTYSYDGTVPDAPTVTLGASTTSPGNDRMPTFTVANPGDVSPGGLTYTCTVSAGAVLLPSADVTQCGPTTTLNLAGVSDGLITVEVTATDAAENVSLTSGSVVYALDATAQAPTVSRTSPTGSSATATSAAFSISDNEVADGPDVFSCTWSGPGITAPVAAPCASGDAFPAATDGHYTLSVTATDSLGNVSSATTAGYTRDATAQAPTVTLASPTSSPATDSLVSFQIASNEVADGPDTFFCTWSGPGVVTLPALPCVITPTYLTLLDGTYTLSVTGEDTLGNVSTAATATYTRDNVAQAPTVSLATPAGSPGNNTAPTFTITDNELVGGPDSFRCNWSTPSAPSFAFSSCASGDSFTPTVDGRYTLTVDPKDSLGNAGPSASASYVYDGTAPAKPTVTRTSPATSPARATTATFSVTNLGDVSPGGLTYSCVVTNTTTSTAVAAADVSCGSPTTVDLAPTGDGVYQVAVTATDGAGNPSPGAGTATYTVDNAAQAPTVTLATPATSPGKSAAPTFTITGNELVGGPDSFACTWSGPGITAPATAPCVSGASFAATGQGTYTLSVVATDQPGNPSAPTTVTYTRDSKAQAPTVSRSAPATSPAAAGSASFTITDNELVSGPDTFACTWSGPGITTPTAAPCVSGNSFTAGSDGTFTLSVVATDGLGNKSAAATATYARDATAQSPTVTLAAPAMSPAKSSAPSFTITDNELVSGPDTFACTWSGPGISAPTAAPCVSGAAFPAGVDGTYTLSVVATDSLGNPSAPTTATYVRDTGAQAPTVTLSTPATSPAKSSSPTFTIADNELVSGPDTFMCTWSGPGIVSPAAASCVSGASFAASTDGNYTLSVVATDGLGTPSSAATATYTRDNVAQSPTVNLTSPTTSPATSSTPSFSITDNELVGGPDTFMCTWSGPGITTPTAAACLSGDSFTAASDGSYTVSVVAVDSLGNPSAPATASYVRDQTAQPPTVTLATPASSPGKSLAPTFTITSNELVSGPDTFMCTWSGPGITTPTAATCVSGASFTAAADGDYTLSVTATDKLLNTSSAATAAYTLDATVPAAPTVVLATPASSPNKVANPTFTVASPGDTSPGALTYTCVVTNTTTNAVVPAGNVSCGTTTSVNLASTGDGVYTVAVGVTDAAGNSSATTGSASYTLDATAPASPIVALTSPNSPGNSTSPTFSVSNPTDTSPGGLTYSCSATYKPTSTSTPIPLPAADITCGPTTTLDLSSTGDARYTLSVSATDASGNTSATNGTAAYTLDQTVPAAPTVVLATPASSPGKAPSPTFTVSDPTDMSPGGISYLCSASKTSVTPNVVVPAADVSCGATTSLTLGSQGDGDYTLSVTAKDKAGNLSTTTGSATYTLDTTVPAAPVVALATPASSPGLATTPTFTVSSPGDTSPGGLTYSCSVTGRTAVPSSAITCGSTTTVDLSGAARDGSYTLSVTATDAAGNVSAVAGSASYTLDTTLPAAPIVTLTSPNSSPGNVTSPTFSVSNLGDTSPGGITYSCVVTETSVTPNVTVSASRVTCGSTTTVDLSGSGNDGDYTVVVIATDRAGNVSPTGGSATYTLDTHPPAQPVIVLPVASTKLPVFGISDVDTTATLSCLLISPRSLTVFGPAICPVTGSFDTRSFGEGDYTLSVTATDPAGNATSATVTWTRDTTPPPAPTVIALASPANSRNPVFIIDDTEPGVLLDCVLTGPDSSGLTEFTDACPADGGFSIAGLDGVYTLTVTASDTAGNVQPVTASATYTLDTTLPATPVVTRTTPDTSPGSVTLPKFSVVDPDTSPGGITFHCTVSGPTPVPAAAISCGATTSVDLSGASRDGAYTLTVTATDAAGNTSAVAGTATYALDTTAPRAPTVTLITPATSPGNSTSPTFSVVDADTSAGVTFACTVTGPTAVPSSAIGCGVGTTIDLSGAGRDGTYTVSISATDAAGNTSATAGTASYRLDTLPPGTPIVQLANSTHSNTKNPLWTWQFGPNDLTPGEDSAVCVVSGPGGWSSVTPHCAHHVRPMLGGGDGRYSMTVTLTDLAGNTATDVAPPTYHLDSHAPTGAQVTNQTPKSGIGLSRHPSWRVQGPATSTFLCTLLSGGEHGVAVSPKTACSGRVTYDLAGMSDGLYTLRVAAVDVAGNKAFPAYGQYVLVPTAPQVMAPSGDGSLAVWHIIGNPADRFECTLSRGSVVVVDAHACTSRPTFDMAHRPAGSYTLSVVQIGTEDTRSVAGSASWSWSGSGSTSVVPGGHGTQKHDGTGGPGGGGPGGHHGNGPKPKGPLAGLTDVAKHQIRNIVHHVGNSATTHFPAIPHTSGLSSGVASAVQNVVHSIGAAGGGTGFPLLLVGLVLIFVIAQNRIDRRDPKLALASIAADDMVEFQNPPSRRDRP